MRNVVKVLDFASGDFFLFDPSWRCAESPAYIKSPPHYTDEDAFNSTQIRTLADASAADEVYIEWTDKFLIWDADMSMFEYGSYVWKLGRVVEHTSRGNG